MLTNTCSNSTIKALKQRRRILLWCLILLSLNSYFFIGTNFIGVQQELSDAMQNLEQCAIRYELNQKRIQQKFNPTSSPLMWVCMEAMVKFTKRLKEIVQIMYLYCMGKSFFWYNMGSPHLTFSLSVGSTTFFTLTTVAFRATKILSTVGVYIPVNCSLQSKPNPVNSWSWHSCQP